MSIKNLEDFGSARISGRIFPVSFIIFTIFLGIFIIVLSFYIELFQGGKIESESMAFVFIFVFLFISFSLLSIILTKNMTVWIMKEGVFTRYRNGRYISFKWGQIKEIKTDFYTIPIFKGHFIRIVGTRKTILIHEYLPYDKKLFYYTLALLFMYATIHKIPFSDRADLMKNRHIMKLGFIYPNVVHHGRYFEQKFSIEEMKKKMRFCPKCRNSVLPMHIGRCPNCGFRFHRRPDGPIFKRNV